MGFEPTNPKRIRFSKPVRLATTRLLHTICPYTQRQALRPLAFMVIITTCRKRRLLPQTVGTNKIAQARLCIKTCANSSNNSGAPGAIRTHDLLFRKQMLYPTELRVLLTLASNTTKSQPLTSQSAIVPE